uniref:hypothetical protein n=1 Tax=Hypnea brasiliensis TaxID=1866962 RepID=UPI0023F1A99F|nr:hypothetical protein P8481_pgp099 [Hypnea brasiliensis]WCH55248.1 hypothetical protein [Hypnea brasiliensis]WDY84773.1 hypothetical protein [Hypnea brasiliensis]
MNNYYFAIASKKFLVEAEPIEEILRERTNYYLSNKKIIDFWFIDNPKFIHKPEFQNLKRMINSTPAAIISLDKEFIEWIKLRISFVLTGEFKSESL